MAFGGFVDEYTNSPVQPAFSTYLGLNLTGDIELNWSQFGVNITNPLSQLIVVTANNSTANEVSLPDATFSSVQQTLFIANQSNTSFNVVDFTGGASTQILPGQVWFYALTSNSTAAGTWFKSILGGTIQPITAGDLVNPGYGLFAEGGLIKINFEATQITNGNTPYNLTNNDRGHLLVYTAGTSNIILPLASSFAVSGFLVNIANQSFTAGGICTLVPQGGNTINGATSSFSLNPGESTILIRDSLTNWITLCFSSSQNNSFQAEEIPINAATTNVSIDQASDQLQIFVNGSYTPAATVLYPNTFPQSYIFWNKTTGPGQNITVSQPAPSTKSYTIAPGDTLALFSDGINLYPILSKVYLSDGTPALPTLTFASDEAKGFYSSAVNKIGVSISGQDRVNFSSLGLELTASATTILPSLVSKTSTNSGFGITGTPSLIGSLGGVNTFEWLNASLTTNSQVRLATGATPTYSFQGNLTSGMGLSTGPLQLNLMTGGVNALTISASQVVNLANALPLTSGGTGGNTAITGSNNLLLPILTANGDLLTRTGGALARLALSATLGRNLTTTPTGASWNGLGILQIVSLEYTLTEFFNNTSLTDIPNLVLAITPSATNSRIFIICDLTMDVTAGQALYVQLTRQIGAASPSPIFPDSGRIPFVTTTITSFQTFPIIYLDNPTTLSPVTYRIQGAVTSGTGSLNENAAATYNAASSIYLVEIGGF